MDRLFERKRPRRWRRRLVSADYPDGGSRARSRSAERSVVRQPGCSVTSRQAAQYRINNATRSPFLS